MDYSLKDPAMFPSKVKPFADVVIGEDCETFDGRKGVVLQKGTLETLFDYGDSAAILAMETEEYAGDEDAIVVQLEDADAPTLYPYSRETAFVRDVFHEADF